MRVLWALVAAATSWPLAHAQRLHPSALSTAPPLEARARVLAEAEGVAATGRQEGGDEDTDDEVTDLPGLDPTAKVAQHAGRVALDDGAKNQLFYWHFPAASDPDAAPLVIW